MIILDEKNFDQEVIQSSEPVFVDFFATWCGPCKMMSPLVDAAESAFEGVAKFGKLDIDAGMEIAQRYGIMSVPTFMVFKGGEPVATKIGGMSKGDLETFIKQAVG